MGGCQVVTFTCMEVKGGKGEGVGEGEEAGHRGRISPKRSKVSQVSVGRG